MVGHAEALEIGKLLTGRFQEWVTRTKGIGSPEGRVFRDDLGFELTVPFHQGLASDMLGTKRVSKLMLKKEHFTTIVGEASLT